MDREKGSSRVVAGRFDELIVALVQTTVMPSTITAMISPNAVRGNGVQQGDCAKLEAAV